MPPKKSEDPATLLQWLYDRGEATIGQVLQEVVGRPGLADGLAKMLHSAAKTKGQVDKNVETVLHLMSLPSRADYRKLLVKIEHLQGSLVNLNMKLDRLVAAQESSQRKKKIVPQGVS